MLKPSPAALHFTEMRYTVETKCSYERGPKTTLGTLSISTRHVSFKAVCFNCLCDCSSPKLRRFYVRNLIPSFKAEVDLQIPVVRIGQVEKCTSQDIPNSGLLVPESAATTIVVILLVFLIFVLSCDINTIELRHINFTISMILKPFWPA